MERSWKEKYLGIIVNAVKWTMSVILVTIELKRALAKKLIKKTPIRLLKEA